MAVTDEAITKIKEMLISGQLKAGDRLPPENELSDHLGLSRSSLREAVKALELIRVLDVRRGDGTYVTSLEPGLLTETMGFMVEIHQESSAPELMEVRRILEPGAAAHAAARINARGLAALRTCLDSIPAQATAAQLAAHDFTFHSQIARASGNPYLAGMLDSLTGSALRLRTWQRIVEAGAVSAILSEHSAILEALTLGDADLARSLMTVHVASAERWLRRPAAEAVPPAAAPFAQPAFPSAPVRRLEPEPVPETERGSEWERVSGRDPVAPRTTTPAPEPAPVRASPRAKTRKQPTAPLPVSPAARGAERQQPQSTPVMRSAPAQSSTQSSPEGQSSPEEQSNPAQSSPEEQSNPAQSSPEEQSSPTQSASAAQSRTAPQISRIAPEPALYELFAMPSAPVQKAARKPRRPA
ncbi:FCD domain-containing protein [Arthrobacter citreus]|uniref:FCD domain-containing protein n=1 Tax=Arthrobacter citreus TaxID=1670 RepID=A0ABZ2ZSW7_9MICC